MPVINVTLIQGYDADARRRLSERLTDATRSVIKAPAEVVTVVINEVDGSNYMRGGVSRKPGPAHADQTLIVKDYLAAMEARDLEKSASYLAPDFTMTFPGGVSFTRPDQLVDWAKTRYQSISKTFERFDECVGGDEAVVFCFGTLQGVWPDGSEFSGVRFIDRFTLVDGLICKQLVWNDLAELFSGK